MQSATAMIWSTRYSARRDLRVQANTDKKLSAYFNVLDPITRQSFRVGELEHSLLLALNGNRTLGQVLKLLRKASPYESLTEQQLLLTVEQLQRSGLIRASQVAKGSGGRGRVPDTLRAQAWLAGFVSWQLRGLQPDAWLAKLAPHTNAIFSQKAVVLWLLLAAATCLGVLLEFPRLANQSAAWQWIVHPVQGSALFAVFLITRALHELGHAVVCKRHGVRCPDIGLFIVLGAPCVYCDVSESWQLPNRWQRAAVAAAGMYVELIVATLAAWVWMLTIDGPANTVALQTMFVCSVSTLLINANPLMRFDGYYILSDILDESNLRGRADAIAETRLYRLILGRVAVPLQASGGKYERATNELAQLDGRTYVHLLCVFSWMGWVYRAGLSLAIAGVLVTIYESWNIAWVGRTIAVLILISWWGIPTVKLAKNLIQMAGKTNKRLRLLWASFAFVGCVGLVPVPYRQFASGWVQPESMRGVYAPADGILKCCEDNEFSENECIEKTPQSGCEVEEGDFLFSLHDIDAILDAMRKDAMQRRAWAEYESHRQSLSQATESYKTAYENSMDRFEEAAKELEKRNLKSPITGRFVAMPANPPTGPWSIAADSLRYDWDGSNQAGRMIAKGTMLAAICGSQRIAVIPLSDSQLEWIRSGTEVRLRCVERPEVFQCKVDKVVPLEEINAAWRLVHGELANGAAGTSSTKASNSIAGQKHSAVAYAAQISLPEDVGGSIGAQIDGVFIAPSQTVGSLGYRWLQQNLRWLAD